MDPEQSDLGLQCLLERLLKHFSSRQKQTTFVVIGVLRVKLFDCLHGNFACFVIYEHYCF